MFFGGIAVTVLLTCSFASFGYELLDKFSTADCLQVPAIATSLVPPECLIEIWGEIAPQTETTTTTPTTTTYSTIPTTTTTYWTTPTTTTTYSTTPTTTTYSTTPTTTTAYSTTPTTTTTYIPSTEETTSTECPFFTCTSYTANIDELSNSPTQDISTDDPPALTGISLAVLNHNYECIGYSKRRVRIRSLKRQIHIVCSAEYPIRTTPTFQDGIPNYKDTRITYTKSFTSNSSGPSPGIITYTTRIQPDADSRRSIKYTISPSAGNTHPDDEVINTEILILYESKIGGECGGDCDAYWMPMPEINFVTDWSVSEYPILVATQEILTIPCVLYNYEVYQGLYYDTGGGDWIPLTDEQEGVTYDPSRGFLLNLTEFYMYRTLYECLGQDLDLIFQVSDYLQNTTIFPSEEVVSHYMHGGSNNSGLVLECSANSLVSLEGQITFNNGDVRDVSGEITSSLLPTPRYIARYVSHDLQPSDRIDMTCRNFTNPMQPIIHHFNISVRDVESNPVLNLQMNRSISKFICSSSIQMSDDIDLLFAKCNTRGECESVKPCLAIPNFHHPCHERIDVYKGIRGSDCNCSTLEEKGNGIVLCSTNMGGNKYTQIRFKGLDHIQYYLDQKDIPNVAKITIWKNGFTNTDETDGDNGELRLRTGVEYVFECRSQRFFSEGDFQWVLGLYTGERTAPVDGIATISYQDIAILEEFAIQSVMVTFLSTDVTGLICRTPQWELEDWIEYEMKITILASKIPEIVETPKEYALKEELDHSVTCNAIGFPQPRIKWTTSSGDEIKKPIEVQENTLFFPKFNSAMIGDYLCNASNVLGFSTQEIAVKVEVEVEATSPGLSTPVIIGITGGGTVVIAIPLIIGIIYYRRKKQVKLDKTEVDTFRYGASKNSYDTLPMPTPKQNVPERHSIDFLPFPRQYEIQKERLIIDKTRPLGIGEYGKVYLGKLEYNSLEPPKPVAIKIPKPDCPPEIFKTLLSELKIMAHMGSHENIIKLVGAHTEEIRRGVLYIVTEFCPLGSLEEFLVTNRGKYDSGGFKIEINAHKKYQAVDAFKDAPIFGFGDLLQWTCGIACGMEFLAGRNIIHADLATRNVLLNANRIAKISDFGLSRRLYHYNKYVKSSDLAMPWRWLAIESLISNSYSSQSDVWSFGITMWEIFSLGNIPYPGLEWSIDFGNQLREGLRNTKPDYASLELYNIMKECWKTHPNERPTFTQLKEKLILYEREIPSTSAVTGVYQGSLLPRLVTETNYMEMGFVDEFP